MDNRQAHANWSFDEIVFEGRNREYGAFLLRQLIPRHTYLALGITALLVLLTIASRFIQLEKRSEVLTPLYNVTEISLSEPPPILEVLPPAVPQALAPAADAVIGEMEVKKDTEVPDANLSNTETKGDSTSTGTATEGSANSSVLHGDGKTIYKSLEVMPQYPGGSKGIQRYLSDNLKYPDVAKQNGITGTVFVIFVVNEDGSVSDVKIEKGIGGGCDQEAIRVVEAMTRWKPGKQGGEPKACYMRMPITFRLDGM